MNLKIFSIFFLISFFFFLPYPVFAAKPSPSSRPTHPPKRIVIGAALRDYKQPREKDCDIKVPKDYSTIQAAVNAASNGDTVCVDEGIYNENVRINNSIKLSGGGATKSMINGRITDEDPGYYTVYLNANNITIEGFYIKGIGDSNDATMLSSPDNALSEEIIRYNRIVAGKGELALRTDGHQTNNLIQDNIFEGNESPQIVSVVVGENVDFLNNTFIGTVPTSYPYFGDVLVDGASNSMIKQNVFNATGIIRTLVMASRPSVISENNLNTGNRFKVYNYPSEGVLNAENNWWGDLDPSDNVQGDVDYTPFATSPFLEN